jgi:hypothetical protein
VTAVTNDDRRYLSDLVFVYLRSPENLEEANLERALKHACKRTRVDIDLLLETATNYARRPRLDWDLMVSARGELPGERLG